MTVAVQHSPPAAANHDVPLSGDGIWEKVTKKHVVSHSSGPALVNSLVLEPPPPTLKPTIASSCRQTLPSVPELAYLTSSEDMSTWMTLHMAKLAT
ncbi:hypothetical protein NL676_018107 [Syzygium grande]|nr:hypothetical protein NL676_018107 [Syzygium grande]